MVLGILQVDTVVREMGNLASFFLCGVMPAGEGIDAWDIKTCFACVSHSMFNKQTFFSSELNIHKHTYNLGSIYIKVEVTKF